MTTITLEKARKDFEAIYHRADNLAWTRMSEQDTLTKFIHPLLTALGWDVLNFDEVREEVHVKTGAKDNHMDLVLYLNKSPCVGIEVKSIAYGNLLDDAGIHIGENVRHLLKDLEIKSKQLNVKYAVLTRFVDTLVFQGDSMTQVAAFCRLEHILKFDVLWKLLSKQGQRALVEQAH
jgi:hypothetical protein